MRHTARMERLFTVLAGLNGAIAVALGAYGAHGLEQALAGAEEIGKRLDWWRTAVSYQLPHAVALGVAAWLVTRRPGRGPVVAGVGFSLGILLFSGTLYAMALGAPRWLGAITPLGGTALIVGWLAVAWSGARPTP